MTTWTQDHARKVSTKLHDVNFYLSIARVNLLNGHNEMAATYVEAARMAKDESVAEFPPIKLNNGEELQFLELYQHFWIKDLMMYHIHCAARAAQNPNLPDAHMYPEWSQIQGILQDTVTRLRALLNRPWPATPDCKSKLERIIQSIESAIQFMQQHPADQADLDLIAEGARQLEQAQKEFLECAYPNSPIPMKESLDQLNAMNLWLIFIYSAVQFDLNPYFPNKQARLSDTLFLINIVEGFKAVFLEWLNEGYGGVTEPMDQWPSEGSDVIPGVDPLPPRPNHASSGSNNSGMLAFVSQRPLLFGSATLAVNGSILTGTGMATEITGLIWTGGIIIITAGILAIGNLIRKNQRE